MKNTLNLCLSECGYEMSDVRRKPPMVFYTAQSVPGSCTNNALLTMKNLFVKKWRRKKCSLSLMRNWTKHDVLCIIGIGKNSLIQWNVNCVWIFEKRHGLLIAVHSVVSLNFLSLNSMNTEDKINEIIETKWEWAKEKKNDTPTCIYRSTFFHNLSNS